MPEDLIVSYLSGDPIVGYMAVQFKGISENGGWLPTTWGENVANAFTPANPNKVIDYLPIDSTGSTPKNGPPKINAYSPVVGIEWTMESEYVSGSYGGTRTASRVDISNLEVEREVDQISPYFMEYAADGIQLAYVHLVHMTRKQVDSNKPEQEKSGSSQMELISWIILTNCFVSKYFYGTKAEKGEKGSAPSITHYEKVEFDYSTISFQSGTTTKTWSKGTDSGT